MILFVISVFSSCKSCKKNKNGLQYFRAVDLHLFFPDPVVLLIADPDPALNFFKQITGTGTL